MHKHRVAVSISLVFVTAAASPLAAQRTAPHDARGAFALAPCQIANVAARCGTYWVYEDRAARTGRTIPLKVIVLPSASPTPAADPLWYVSPGGPGTTNSDNAAAIANFWWREQREVVIVDLRGTSGPKPLDCHLSGTAEKPNDYLQSLFRPALVKACHDELSRDANLGLYTSELIADDLDEVRGALGYAKVNLYGVSWGTRAVLIYLRRHPESVRSAIIEGVAPTSFKNPLPHARSAQDALMLLFAECAKQASCHAAFPDPKHDFDVVLSRLHAAPARFAIDGDSVSLTWQQFADAVRVMTYYIPNAIRVPLLLHQAAQGDLTAFARAGIASNRGLRDRIRFGFLLSITCTEDVPRILPSEIAPETDGTYLGDSRVREQMTACGNWTRGVVSKDYGDPVRSTVPVFLLSGTLDPVSPPHFAADAAKFLPNSIHVTAPGAHVPNGPCVVSMERTFLNSASASAVDRSCIAGMTLAPFVTEPPK